MRLSDDQRKKKAAAGLCCISGAYLSAGINAITEQKCDSASETKSLPK